MSLSTLYCCVAYTNELRSDSRWRIEETHTVLFECWSAERDHGWYIFVYVLFFIFFSLNVNHQRNT